ncbi:hypothetical protein NSTC745_02022 [Nostoc sp. DSM 114161]|jgi:hypothetical protein
MREIFYVRNLNRIVVYTIIISQIRTKNLAKLKNTFKVLIFTGLMLQNSKY